MPSPQALTWSQIIEAMSDGQERTRAEISEMIDTTTAGAFLPVMVDAGIMTVTGWPYRYRLISEQAKEKASA
jgi:hypothetical protein